MGLLARTLAVCLLVVVIQDVTVTGEVVNLPSLGMLDGTTTTSYWNNRTIFQYQGIPFAEPPTGTLRFKRPVKYTKPWTGTAMYDDFGPICPQNLDGPLRETAVQDENCLTLNVYTTKTTGGGIGTGQAVMVFIHGGSFRVGSAQSFTPEYLLERDVILVVPQYRLGPLGFMSLKTEAIPGNQGMLDVIMALEWVKENIQYFGGDPSRVTLFGQSAGGAAVTSMLFSPLVQDGLIQRMIAHSGSVLGTWAVDPEPELHTRMMGEIAACPDVADDTKLTECLMGLTAQQVLDIHTQFLVNDIISGGRAVGGNHLVFSEAGEKSFLPKDPAVLLSEGSFKHIPYMSGTTKHEGSWFLGNLYDLILVPNNLLDESPTSIAYMTYDITKQVLEYSGIEDRTGYVADATQVLYFTENELGNFTRMTSGLMDIIGVGLLKASTFTLAKEMSRHADSYMYSFNFFGRHTSFTPETTSHYPFTGGVAHSDDLFYLFPRGKELNAREAAMAKIMVQYWTNFAINGVPSAEGSPVWPKMTTPVGPYMRILSEPMLYNNYVSTEFQAAKIDGLEEPAPSSATIHRPSLLKVVLLAVAMLLLLSVIGL